MATTKLNPWNWFKREHEQTLPVRRNDQGAGVPAAPLDQFHAEFDRMVESMFSDFGLRTPGFMQSRLRDAAIRPKVDVYGTDKEYVVQADLPGVEEKDLSVEIDGDVLILTAEKHSEEKTEDKGYYRVERSSGVFRRVLDLPDDVDRDKIQARLEKGVLCVTMPRTGKPEGVSRKIAIEGSAEA
ncbi:heat shock protein Hsp20 [Pseudodesulfovibrio mercurii]|uniref:Heat shock protein Hsp20 n=1 Tax=Pseudodesulfovibrio mercurii TaxID=641491 RepID=F0JIK4_9BACT|nr:Hsp20/alpha crystallin family protein [Pseudodesulfovibrio mercurii]EGB15438.1 heat shock protein Hsp20 [Pseudodesulfovibrio mercurii]